MNETTGVLWRDSSVEGLLQNAYGSPPFARLALPGDAMREASSVSDLGYWYAIGDCWAQIVAAHLPDGTSNVLDLGCSCAKIARFLSFDPRVRYLGLDVFEPAILWCRREFAHIPHFRFKHLDVKSSIYNPKGAVDPEHAALPIPERSIDVLVAGSLFTHLRRAAFKRYLAETARCLKETGVAIVSVQINEAIEEIAGDEAGIEINPDYFGRLVSAAGMSASLWQANVFGQTVMVLRRA